MENSSIFRSCNCLERILIAKSGSLIWLGQEVWGLLQYGHSEQSAYRALQEHYLALYNVLLSLLSLPNVVIYIQEGNTLVLACLCKLQLLKAALQFRIPTDEHKGDQQLVPV